MHAEQGTAFMDHETLQALINVYRAHASADLLSIIIDETEGPLASTLVLELLRSIDNHTLADPKFAPGRRKACNFALKAEDFALAERLARTSDLPEDKVMLARAFHGLGREQEAISVYRQAIAQDPAIRNRDLERLLGIRPGLVTNPQPAKVISLTNYSSRREGKAGEQDRRDASVELYADDFDETAVTFADVAGLDHVKAEIRRRIVLPYLKPSLFERFKRKPGGSILLYGPPGCGKTLIARAAAGECDARFLAVTPSDILDKYSGEAEKRLRAFFDEARGDTPSVLFFDDIDVIGLKRRATIADPAPGLVSALTTELDSLQRGNRGVLLLAATNAPWSLDPALLRSGRFSRFLFVPPPDLAVRTKILTAAITGLPGADKIAIDKLARRCSGYSGADLLVLMERVCDNAVEQSLAGAQNVQLTPVLLDEAMKSITPSTLEWSRHARARVQALEGFDSFLSLFSYLDRSKMALT
jgi:AAA+ superfamily predicted ATPase